jgi:hypothetical protein
MTVEIVSQMVFSPKASCSLSVGAALRVVLVTNKITKSTCENNLSIKTKILFYREVSCAVLYCFYYS